MNAIDATTVGLNAVRKITDVWGSARSDSLIDYTRQTRVEPIALIDTDCLYLEALPDVMQSLQSIFCGYYMQAVAVSTNVGNINVGRHLDRLNPNRNVSDTAAQSAGWLLATENYKHRLPTYDNAVAMEAIGDHIPTNVANHIDAKLAEANKPSTERVGFGKNAAQAMHELANLSVGKILEVEISDGGHKATIPIAIRLMASSLPSASLVHILTADSDDLSTSVKERYHAWKSGRLEFIKDLVLCQDLIDARRKNLIHDKDGVYSNMIARRRNNGLSTMLSGNPSVATASNLVVVSSDTAKQIELKMGSVGGKLKNFKDREQLFKNTSVMIMAVIDKQWERVTFYHRGIPETTEASVRDLKISNKGSGPDVSDILKAYQFGNAPAL